MNRPSCRGDHVQGTTVRGLWPSAPQRRGQAHACKLPLTLVGGLRLCCRAAAPLLTVKFRQPSKEFTFRVGMTFVSYPLVLTPVV
jgi:hypothetical protein